MFFFFLLLNVQLLKDIFCYIDCRVGQIFGRNSRWGERITNALSTFNTTTEVRPLSKAPNPQLLHGRRNTGCPLLRVCVHGVCVFTTVC